MTKKLLAFFVIVSLAFVSCSPIVEAAKPKSKTHNTCVIKLGKLAKINIKF